MFWKRKPRFRDIPAKAPELPKTERIAFFAPHTSEHPAVMPLISKLREKLEPRGIGTETHSVDSMRDDVISISAKLRQYKFSREGKAALESFFRMRDAERRLCILEGILGQEPGKLAVEVHALPMEYFGNEHFPLIGQYYRVPGTRVLFPRELKSEYEKPILLGMAHLESNGEDALSFAKRLLCVNHDDAEAMLGKLDIILKRTLLIEIPATSKQDMETGVNTEFERSYGIGISESSSIAGFEIDELVALFSGLSV